ncbi:MAG: TIGR02646 family protein [Mediterranea sp.]|jgi:uncharacterized protein (TIGR02646 family)|nr:TIGR02646 family protein [Mediterranea sp.]
MKQINKGETPAFFSDFVKKNKPRDWEDIAPIRPKLRQHILAEQNGCCAYTEVRIVNDNCHIDHYRTRNLFSKLTFDYCNLMVATNAEGYGAKYKDKYIAKGDYDDLINPVEENPSDYLEFTYTGIVNAKNKCRKGEKTIELFNLNERNLVNRRIARILQINSFGKEFSVDEVIDFFKGEFASMITQLYNEEL